MIEVLRNMFRRKFRTFLTVFGISIGMFAFTVMGAMALKINRMIEGGKTYIIGQITVSPKGSSMMTGQTAGTLPIDTLNKIAAVEGVEAVEGSVSLPLADFNPEEAGGFNVGMPATITTVSVDSKFVNRNWKSMAMKEGKLIDKDSPDNAVAIGYTIALDKKWKVGDEVTIRGKSFQVIGILDKTMTGPDSYIFMKLPVARELYVEANPFLKSLKTKADEAAKIPASEVAKLSPEAQAQILEARSFNIDDVNDTASVSWKDGEDPEVVVERIKSQYKDEVTVLSPKKMGEEIDKATATFNAVVLGAALLALIVGGFSIINTMVMSISERTREIGIKKAIGATSGTIAKEYTLEAGVIGLLGGIVGVGFGSLVIYLINQQYAEKGAEIFLLETGFIIQVLVFSFVLGIIAGVIPALRASKMNPVSALKQE